MSAGAGRTEPAVRGGRLTIFAGCAPGTGKTYAMLQAALRAQAAGVDVVTGTDGGRWPETRALAETLERLPGRAEAGELDLDAALERGPALLLVDDLGRHNGPACRHRKRSQDVEELLKAGVDVYATLNVTCIESLQDAVQSILGENLPDRVPDGVFDGAFQVVLADWDPSGLPARLEGRFTSAQLTALRELALRRCADRLARESRGEPEGYRAAEHILVCLSSAPSNARIIRTAGRMADAFHGALTALFVETGEFQHVSGADRARLEEHIRLARQLGASIETVYGDDIPYQIAEFARLSGVTKIVIGRSAVSRRTPWGKPVLTERLIALAPELDIHIIPDQGTLTAPRRPRPLAAFLAPPPLRDLAKSALLLAAATLTGFIFYYFGLTEANIITVYLLSVMLIAVVTKSSVCSFVASAGSVLIFNFLFTDPRFSLHAYDSSYPVTFLVMFLAALLTGSLATKLKSHAQRSAQLAWRTGVLFETNQSLQKAADAGEILAVAAGQLVKLFGRDVAVYEARQGALESPRIFPAGGQKGDYPWERRVAEWVLKNNRRAGAGTETFSEAPCLYLAVRAGDRVYGVIGLAAGDRPLEAFENSILLSILGECALALESRRNAREKEEAAVLAKNEQLRANLLRAISHDLRTPLTSISGNAGNLLSHGALFDEETKRQMYEDIYDDAMWLINLVENLLSVSRLEEGRMTLRLSTELMEEVVGEALRHVDRRSKDYHLTVESGPEYLLARIDARLIVQVLINLIDNAVKYTPPGSHITITLGRMGEQVRVSVADDGPGIPREMQQRVFDMFFTGANRIGDSRRSLGLGLALCKSIVSAHGGEISVADNKPHGAVFTFTVPSGEVELHE